MIIDAFAFVKSLFKINSVTPGTADTTSIFLKSLSNVSAYLYGPLNCV